MRARIRQGGLTSILTVFYSTDHPGSATLSLSYSNIDHCDSINSFVDNSDLNCSGNSFNPIKPDRD